MILIPHFTKYCNKCKQIKHLVLFSKNKSTKDGIQAYCKECIKTNAALNKDKTSEYKNKYYHDNKDKAVQYRIDNKIKISERMRNYKIDNKDKLSKYNSEYQAKYYQANKESLAEYQKEYKAINKDKVSNMYREYRMTERGKLSHKNSNHKRRSIENKGDIETTQLLELQKTAKVCYWCKSLLVGLKVHIDHYIPLAKGGEHTISNLVVSCQSCNLKKNAKDPIAFANSLGRLL